MADPVILKPDDDMTFWDKHRFSLLLVFVVLIALTLTAISMIAYNVSGTAQLDLSRPGFQSVSGKVDKAGKVTEYSAFGSVNKDTIDEFTKLYDDQASKAKSVDAFSGDPLNPDALEFGVSNASE